MTDKPTPTDAELKAMWQLHAADIGGIFYYARAVLARWGQPAQAADNVQGDALDAEVLRDAERYRFIRDVPYSDDVRSVLVQQQNAAMDRVIDAARKQGEAMTTDNWEAITETRPAQGVAVLTKIDGAGGPRNEQVLVRTGNLWFFSDMSMYVYYTPTHFKEQPNDR